MGPRREGRVGRIRPFDDTGVERGPDGGLRFVDRPPSIGAMLHETVLAHRSVQAVVEIGGRRLSYGELWDEATRVAGGLSECGVRRGDRVTVELPNGVNWMVAYFGTILAGAVVVPVNTRLTAREAGYIINDCGAVYRFQPGAGLPHGAPLWCEDVEPDDVAAIFYTSGTTGFPKGAAASHRNFLTVNESCRRAFGMEQVGPGEIRSLVTVPLFHTTGCNAQMLPVTEVAGTSVILPAFDVAATLRAIEVEQIDFMVSVPSIYWLLMNSPDFSRCHPERLRRILFGGAPMPLEVLTRLSRAFPNARLGNGFGLTETSSLATLLPHEYIGARPETVGFPVPVVEVDLAAPDGGAVGELLVRGASVVAGYWNNPRATAESFVDGWFHTGDVAAIDDDGYVQIVDRIKDVIIRGGENVYSVEVENAISGFPGVLESAVVGLDDEVMGQRVGAVIVPMSGTDVDPDEVRDWLGGHLADYKIPERIVVSARPLPRNPAGKVLKERVRTGVDWPAVRR